MKFITYLIVGIIMISYCFSYNLDNYVLQWEDQVKITKNIFNGADAKVSNNTIHLFYFVSSPDNFNKVRDFYSDFSNHLPMEMWKNGLMVNISGESIKKIKIKGKDSDYQISIRTPDISSPNNEVKIQCLTRENDQTLVKALRQMKLPNGKLVEVAAKPSDESDNEDENSSNTTHHPTNVQNPLPTTPPNSSSTTPLTNQQNTIQPAPTQPTASVSSQPVTQPTTQQPVTQPASTPQTTAAAPQAPAPNSAPVQTPAVAPSAPIPPTTPSTTGTQTATNSVPLAPPATTTGGTNTQPATASIPAKTPAREFLNKSE